MEPNLDYNVLSKSVNDKKIKKEAILYPEKAMGDPAGQVSVNVGDNVIFMGTAVDDTGREFPAGTEGSVSDVKGYDEVYVKPSGVNTAIKVKMNQIRKASRIIEMVEVSGKDLLL